MCVNMLSVCNYVTCVCVLPCYMRVIMLQVCYQACYHATCVLPKLNLHLHVHIVKIRRGCALLRSRAVSQGASDVNFVYGERLQQTGTTSGLVDLSLATAARKLQGPKVVRKSHDTYHRHQARRIPIYACLY